MMADQFGVTALQLRNVFGDLGDVGSRMRG